MKQQRLQNIQQPWLQSQIHIFGYFANKLNFHTQIDSTFYPNTIDQSIRQLHGRKKDNTKFIPVKIYSESSAITIIDKQQKGWIITDFLGEPICLSDLLKLKIYKISLGYNQLIVNTKQGCLLIVWGNKKPIDEQNLEKYTIKNSKHKYFHVFQGFKICKTTKNDNFMFTNLKKVVDQNSLFSVSQEEPQALITYPKLQKLIFPNKVIGLSVGNRHKLCWVQSGKLFSWGCKSLALGLSNVPQQQQIIEPQQITKLQGHVLKAFAGFNYSLAITLEGKLYEWGIKKLFPQGQELIFQPKQIKLPADEKPIDIKGKVDRFGLLTMSGNLYIWGKNIKQYFTNEAVCYNFPQSVRSLDSFNEPFLVSTSFVLDFEISSSFISVIYSSKKVYKQSENQKRYWISLKDKVRQTMRYASCKLKTEKSQPRNQAQKFYSSRAHLSLKKFKDPVQIALKKHQSKQMFMSAAIDSQKLFNYVMEPPRKEFQAISQYSQRSKKTHIDSLTDLRLTTIQSKDVQKNYLMNQLNDQFQRRKQMTKLLQKGVIQIIKKPKIFRLVRNNTQKPKVALKGKKQKSYEQKLTLVMKKRDQLKSQFIERILQSQQKNSLQYRMLKKKQYQQLKSKHKQIQICKNTIQKTLIKAYLVKLFTKPLVEGRELKIANFAKNLKLRRLEKNIKMVFVKNRVRMQMDKLKKCQLSRFFLLLLAFKKYIKKIRLKTFKNQRTKITAQIVKKVVREKIRVGVSACIFNVRKLQKFRQWLALVKSQRKKCLKYLWKVYLLSMMKINSDNESSAIFYLPKNIEELSFQSIYQQKVTNNPLLKLQNFLNKHSIFKLKANYFQRLVTLFSVESKKIKTIQNFDRGCKTKRGRIKFVEDEQIQDKLNLTQTDILPYSLHYNLLIHPSNYDVNISQMIKLNEKWIKQERKILEKHIQLIIEKHEEQYLKKKRVYDIELSIYIKKHYGLFQEKRWKYIIQYNKLEKTFQKQKKQNQLRRLMKLTASSYLLDSDYVPQKHAILDEALKRFDSPQIPNNFIVFKQSDFRVLFKSYYQSVTAKLKELKGSIR